MAHPITELLFGSPGGGGDDGRSDQGGRRRTPRGVDTARSDPELVERIRDGDVDAFRRVYLDTFSDLWTFARRYTKSAEAAEEVVHDVFLRVWERRTTWEVRDSVRSYLFGAVRNRALHAVEHGAVERRAGDAVAREQRAERSMASFGADPSDAVEQQDLYDAVMRALEALPERQRAAMLLRFRHGLSYAQIGDALGIAAAVAGRLVVKAERRLREQLSGVLGTE